MNYAQTALALNSNGSELLALLAPMGDAAEGYNIKVVGQDWENETTIVRFEDGSALAFSGSDVRVVGPRKAAVTLTAYNMGGDATESDFDSFAAYVAEHIDERTGLDVTVDQFRFEGSGVAKDRIEAASDDDRETIQGALRGLWDDWCSSGAEIA